MLFLLRIDNHSLVYSFNVRVTFKTNKAVCKETTESPSTPQFSTCRARAVAQWLVPATDDRVVAGLNPSPVTH